MAAGVANEEALIESCIRIRLASTEALTAAQVYATLISEGAAVEAGAVKKACSKATKRMAAASANPAAATAAPASAAESEASSKQKIKAAKAATEALKAAESAMMSSQKVLRDKVGTSRSNTTPSHPACHSRALRSRVPGSPAQWMFDGQGGAPPSDTKAFIQLATARAVSGTLDVGESVSKERVDADVATLQWVLHSGSPFELPEEQRVAARVQLDKLESIRRVTSPFTPAETSSGARSGCVFKKGEQGLGYYHEAWFAAATACYVARVSPEAAAAADELVDLSDPVLGKSVELNDNASLDRVMARAGMLTAGSTAGDEMDEMD